VPSPPNLPPQGKSSTSPPPLHGVRVVDFTRVLAGPFGTQILAELGAEVIKIENPHGGDETRARHGATTLDDESPFFLSLNRSKQSVAIDLKHLDGQRVALDLIGTADVLVENFSGPVMRRFQLDYATIRSRFPSLIYCSVSAYGRTGSNADAAGYDSPLSAEAGILSLNAYVGQAPVLGGTPYTDITTALNATIGILAALQARARDGHGQHVDIAMFDTAVANLTFRGYEFLATGNEPALGVEQVAGPRGRFETADGSIVITCSNDKMFNAFCHHVVDRPEWLADERFATLSERMRNSDVVLAGIRAALKEHASAALSERCKQVGIPCGALRTPGAALLSDEADERGLVFGIPHADGVVPAIAQPYRLSETPCRYDPPPTLGQHTVELLTQLLGYDDAQVERLAESGAIGRAKASAD